MGDVVLVKAGDKVAADLRMIQVSSDAKFDRSILTGESLPVGATEKMTETNYMETRELCPLAFLCSQAAADSASPGWFRQHRTRGHPVHGRHRDRHRGRTRQRHHLRAHRQSCRWTTPSALDHAG